MDGGNGGNGNVDVVDNDVDDDDCAALLNMDSNDLEISFKLGVILDELVPNNGVVWFSVSFVESFINSIGSFCCLDWRRKNEIIVKETPKRDKDREIGKQQNEFLLWNFTFSSLKFFT